MKLLSDILVNYLFLNVLVLALEWFLEERKIKQLGLNVTCRFRKLENWRLWVSLLAFGFPQFCNCIYIVLKENIHRK